MKEAWRGLLAKHINLDARWFLKKKNLAKYIDLDARQFWKMNIKNNTKKKNLL